MTNMWGLPDPSWSPSPSIRISSAQEPSKCLEKNLWNLHNVWNLSSLLLISYQEVNILPSGWPTMLDLTSLLNSSQCLLKLHRPCLMQDPWETSQCCLKEDKSETLTFPSTSHTKLSDIVLLNIGIEGFSCSEVLPFHGKMSVVFEKWFENCWDGLLWFPGKVFV